MSTAAQIAANRANSQLSTGPRTLEGKAHSCQNARKDGFTAQTLLIHPDHQDEFADYQESVLQDTRPDGAVESEFVRRILLYGWNLRRIGTLETQLIGESDPAHDEEASTRLHRLARYRRDLERSYDRALAELRRLQTQRAVLLQQNDFVVKEVLAHTPMAELSAITRHTDPVLANYNGLLMNDAARFSDIRRTSRLRQTKPAAGDDCQKEADSGAIPDPELIHAMNSPELTEADKRDFARIYRENAA